MTEIEIVEQLTAVYDRYWTMAQWWVSTSFVLIATAHFGSEKLNITLASILIALYSSFSAWVYFFASHNSEIIGGYLSDLRMMEEQGLTLSTGTRIYFEGSFLSRGALFERISTLVLFFGCNSYLIYSYVNAKRSGT